MLYFNRYTYFTRRLAVESHDRSCHERKRQTEVEEELEEALYRIILIKDYVLFSLEFTNGKLILNNIH